MPNLDLKRWPRSAPVTSIKKGAGGMRKHAQAHPLGTVSAGVWRVCAHGSWHPEPQPRGQQEWLQGSRLAPVLALLSRRCNHDQRCGAQGSLSPGVHWALRGENPSEPLGDFSTHSRMSRVQPALRISGLTSTVIGAYWKHTRQLRSSVNCLSQQNSAGLAGLDGMRSWQPRAHAPREACWESPSPPATAGSEALVTMQCSEAAWLGERNRNTAVQEGQAQLLCGRCRPPVWPGRASNGPGEL